MTIMKNIIQTSLLVAFIKAMISFVFICGLVNIAYSQNNYNRVYVAREAEQTNLKTQTIGDVNVSTVYTDGLSRTVQSVTKQGSPLKKDAVSHAAYDIHGRRTKSYLPFAHSSATDGAYKSNAASLQQTEYGSYGFAESEYENSPLGRVLKRGAPGQDWQLSGSHATELKFDIFDGTSDDVYLWKIDDNGEPFVTRKFISGELTINSVTDAEDHQTKTFSNKSGQVILKKVQGDGSTWLETAYVYDDFGNLRFVFPPEFMKGFHASGEGDPGATPGEQDITLDQTVSFSETHIVSPAHSITLEPGFHFVAGSGKTFVAKVLGGTEVSALLTDFAFKYTYDARHRLVEKQTPGAAPVYFVYDQWNRLVLSQDGEQRKTSQWTYVKYDALNRPVVSGLVTDAQTPAQIQDDVDAGSRYETRTTTGHGYTLNATYPVNPPDADILAVNYYDNYSFVGASYFATGTDYDFDDSDFSGMEDFERVNGLSTGAKIRILGSSTWLKAVSYYDDRLRLIQAIGDNHLGGRDRVSMKYSFASEVLESKSYHFVDDGGSPSATLLTHKEYEYDHLGRLIKAYQQITDGTNPAGSRVMIAENIYNERGELEERNIHATNPGETEFLQSMDYQYNIRGWLTQLNEGGTSTSETNAELDMFGMELYYNNSVSNLTTTEKYDGSISAVSWQSGGGQEKSYAYDYDAIGRLTDATYAAGGSASSWSQDVGAFDVVNVGYDFNGNITGMDRWTKNDSGIKEQMDDLSYTYSGNQLTAVNDTKSSGLGGFEDGAESSNEYTYDDNGNLIKDGNKEISSIAYNHMNLPTEVNFDDGRKLEYTYNALGAKLTEKSYDGASLERTTDYVGGKVYVDGDLQLMQHDAGRVVVNRDGSGNITGYEYQYHLTDHQGNIRATVTSEERATTYTATMESENATVEEAVFSSLSSGNRVAFGSANVTSGGNEVVRLKGEEGPGISLEVAPGDELDLSVWGYYEGTGGFNSTVSSGGLITAVAAAFGGLSGVGGEAGQIFNGIDDALTSVVFSGSNSTPSTDPAAYLNYLVFDKNYNFIAAKSGFKKIPGDDPLVKHEMTHSLSIDQPGYIFVYVSNESDVNYVHFDELEITHTESPIIQGDDFYPFGMNMSSSWKRVDNVANKFLYNQGSEKEDETNWYYTPFRRYDATIGRFNGIDALADQMSSITPYQYGYNNPISFSDPTGLRPGDPEQIPGWALEGYGNPGDNVDWVMNDFGSRFSDHWSNDVYRSEADKFKRDYFTLNGSAFEEAHGVSQLDVHNAFRNGVNLTKRNGKVGYWVDDDEEYVGDEVVEFITINWKGNSYLMMPTIVEGSKFVSFAQNGGGDGSDYYSSGLVTGLNVANIVRGNFEFGGAVAYQELTKGGSAVRLADKAKYTGLVKYGKVVGRAGYGLTAGVAIYEVATGTDNTHTWVDVGVTALGVGAVAVFGTVAAPVVVVGAIGYGIWSIAGGSDWIDSNWGYRPVNKGPK